MPGKEMFKKLLRRYGGRNTDNAPELRRTHPRRSHDRCIGYVNDKPLPVVNWSPGGALLSGDERLYSVGEEVEVTLTFKLEQRIVDIRHKARIIRKTRENIALQFAPLNDAIRGHFEAVMDHGGGKAMA
jgi:hypothetical protein